MSGEDGSETPPERDLPRPVREWLARIATEQGVTEIDLLGRLVDGSDGTSRIDDHADHLDALADDVDEAHASVRELRASLDETRADVAEKIDDVRERVVQVKRETDSKAPADHDHPAIDEELDALRAAFDALRTDVDDCRSDVDDLDAYVTTGFENFESVLEHLTDATDELDGKLDQLVRATLDVRGQVRSLSSLEAERTAVADLAAEANRHGARRADCGSCGESVDVGLLHAPRCPHCDAGFEAFEPKEWFLGTNTLRTGHVPALEGAVVPPDGEDLSSVVGEGPSSAGDVGVDDLVDEVETTNAFSDELGDAGGADVNGWSAGDAEATDTEATTAEATRADDVTMADDGVTPSDGMTTVADAGGDGADGVANDTGAVTDDETETEGTPLQAIDGVGPAYADRLRDAGVANVEQLVGRDPEGLSSDVDVPATRVERWIDRAESITHGD